MTSTPHEVIADPTYGYRRLEPIPSEVQLKRFYEDDYYALLSQGGRAPDLQRLLAGGEPAESERAWLGETLYDDIAAGLLAHGSGGRILEVGCGTGDLLELLRDRGFDVQGIEPSDYAAGLARERGLDVRTMTLEQLVAESGEAPPGYDAVLLVYVLEHIPHAAEMLRGVHRLLATRGLLFISVPNDFNPLQLAAQRELDTEPWWIAIPDHINYFDVESLSALTLQLGFQAVDVLADFPMELFLLMGLNYIGNADLGATCHAYRVAAERSMPSDVRRSLFRSFAANGIGRNLHMFVRKVEVKGPSGSALDLGGPVLSDHRSGYRYPPLRRSDIESLRLFRNAQLDVLRQTEPIAAGEQERWFDEMVTPSQRDPQPPMMLVSILDENGDFIGYGGLTNIDWKSRRAEVSFLVDPMRAADPDVYRRDMGAFLEFLTRWTFAELGLNRLFTETYAFRDVHIAILERAGFLVEGRLREHVTTGEKVTDSVIHGLLATDWRAR
jgi:2-polyprenyl-3-methyl-5-hydroxy-6-metoxy-1,4-benzoquinol methylase/RimJ/RimL family protein N-acetyltransferase